MNYRLENGHLDVQSLMEDMLALGTGNLEEILDEYEKSDVISFAKQAVQMLVLSGEKARSAIIALYGSSSEQLSLFEKENGPATDKQIEEASLVEVEAFKRRAVNVRQKLKIDISCLPEIREDIYGEGFDKEGNLLEGYESIGTEEVKTVENKPSRKFVRNRVLHKAKKSEPDEEGNTIICEPEISRLIPGSVVSPSLLAELVSLKVDFGLSEHRIQRMWAGQDFLVSAQTINNWFHDAGSLIRPMADLILEDFRKQDIVYLDETKLKVVQTGLSKCYVVAGRSGPFEEKQIRLYMFEKSRAQSFVKDVLGPDYGGVLMTDGLQAYRNYQGDGCLKLNDFVHARRNFLEALEIRPGYKEFVKLETPQDRKAWLEKSRDKSFAPLVNILGYFHQLFEIERRLKKEKAGPDQILARRIGASLPVFEILLSETEALSEISVKKFKIHTACDYFIKREKELRSVFDDGHYPFDSNAIERTVKKFVLARKNISFCTSIQGAENLCALFTLCRSAAANGLHLESYLSYVFKTLENQRNDEELLRRLLPYSKDLPSTLYRSNGISAD